VRLWSCDSEHSKVETSDTLQMDALQGIAAGAILGHDERVRSVLSSMPQRTDRLSDEQLMANLGGPEVEASISTLYDRYSRTVFGVGLNMLGDRSLAEELVQEVFLKVWRSSRTFDPSRGSFSTWLYRVTRSVALDLYRKRAHRVRPVSDGDSHLASIRDSSAGPQEVVDKSWLSWRVSRALEMLDAPHREVIELAYFGGLSQREISERTGVPLGTVKTRTASAYKRLRKDLVIQDTSRQVTR
jgi:RNA polymerase sigma-70 factor (ECF subfamily)